MTTAMAAPPDGWSVPEGYIALRLAACKRCGAEVLYTRTADGHHGVRLDRGGGLHLETCQNPVLERLRGDRDDDGADEP